jgi:fatty acid-binding protein DegV
MSVQPPTGVQPAAPQPTTQAPDQQAWNQVLLQYAENAAIPLLASMGLSAIQQATKDAGDN